MGSNSSFYTQNATVYSDTNPAGPADTPVSPNNTTAPSSFYKGTGTQEAPLSLLSGIPAFSPITHNWLTGISATGVWDYAQPSFADISGTIAPSQIPPAALLSLGGVDASTPVANSWVAYIDTSGIQHITQPAFNNISGILAASQLPTPTLTTLGGIEAIAAVAHQWISSIDTAGVPHLSQPSAADVSGLAASATVDTTNAANITSGTLPAARLPVPSATTLGGVESAAAVAHQWIDSISVLGVPHLSQPAAADVSGLAASATTDTTNAANITSGILPAARLPNPSATTLGGVESIAAVAHQWVDSISTLGVPHLSQPSAADISGLAASATTDTTNAANITSGTLPAARLPAPTATTLGGVESIAAVAHQWVDSISTLGVPHLSQPAAADVSGLAASATTDTTNAANITSGTLPAARLPVFTSTVAGAVPASGGGTANFMRADGLWAAPSGGGVGAIGSASGNTDISTTSGAFVDVTGLSTSITTGGGKVLVMCTLPMKVAAAIGFATLNQDGTDAAILATTALTTNTTLTFFALYSPAAGAHTYKARYRNSDAASLVSVNMSSIQNGIIIAIEL